MPAKRFRHIVATRSAGVLPEPRMETKIPGSAVGRTHCDSNYLICLRRFPMKRSAIALSLTGLVVAIGLAVLAAPAMALKPFKDEFEAKYVKPDSKNPNDVALAKAVQEAKCLICHEGKSKKNRNAFGAQLDKLLSEDDVENKKKIQEALEKVAAMKCDPQNPKSPTFGERIKQGKLPAEVKKTP